MAHYSEEDLNKVREANDLATVVGQFSPVRPRGRDLWCCCPLHHEKTPSFKINTATQTWHCFGCGEGGDVFTFVMKMEDLNFPEAVESLAERAHIELPKQDGGAGRTHARKEVLRKICEATAEFYHRQLMRSKSPEADAARRYLASRGMGGEIPNRWQLGFAPGSRALMATLREAGFSVDAMVEAGVVSRSSGGALRDRFFNRVMFPINDVSGRTIAFGGRVLGAGEPKYLNSQETPLFHKSQVLYGLDHAKGAMTASGVAIVVEGYTDVIMLAQAGIENVVATLGTALTMSHLRLLSRHASKRIIYLFDGDAAGQRAADRALGFIDESMTPEAGRLRIALDAVVLPDNLDPADFVATRGADALRALLEDAEPLLSFGIERRLAAHDLTSAEGRSAALTDALAVLAPIKDSLLAADYAVQIAGRLHARESDVLARLAALTPPRPLADEGENVAVDNAAAERRSEPQPQSEPLSQEQRNRLRSERAYLAMLTTHRLAALADADRLGKVSWQSRRHAQWAEALLETLAARPDATEAELASTVIHAVPGSEAALASASASAGERAETVIARLREELALGDEEEAVAAIRARLSADRDLDPEKYEELFQKAVAMQQDLNARRLKLRT